MRTYTARAYAKLNLALDIRGLRADGYHELESVMQTVSLWDTVELTLGRGSGVQLRCNLPYVPADGRNLAVKAALLFYEELGRAVPDMEMKIEKRIPVGAGMAGGSTDGAAVLRLLNRAEGQPFSGEELRALGLKLGADVPFCMVGGTCLCGGVGEQLKKLPAMPGCGILVCKPSVSVSTKAAYGLFDAFANKERADIAAMVAALEAGDLNQVAAAMANSLEAPIVQSRPVIGAVRSQIRASGALGAMMTGSGSAVFGIYPDTAAARKAWRRCRRSVPAAMVLNPVDRI